MDRKKIIIISLSISILIVAVLFCYVYFQGKKQENLSVPNQQSNEPTSNLPISESQNNTTDYTPNAGSTNNNYYVEDSKNTEDIKNAFDEYLSSQSKDKLSWNAILDEEKNPTSIDDFSSAVGIKIDEKINNLLRKDNYYLISCSNGSGMDYGIAMSAKQYAGLYIDEVGFLKDWEKTMLSDLHAILFPKVKFSQTELNKEMIFEGNLDFNEPRFAKINDSLKIYYNIIDEYLVIASSKPCMDKVSSDLIGS